MGSSVEASDGFSATGRTLLSTPPVLALKGLDGGLDFLYFSVPIGMFVARMALVSFIVANGTCADFSVRHRTSLCF